MHIGFGYDAKAGPEDRATQACDPSAEAGGYTAGRVGPVPALSPAEAPASRSLAAGRLRRAGPLSPLEA